MIGVFSGLRKPSVLATWIQIDEILISRVSLLLVFQIVLQEHALLLEADRFVIISKKRFFYLGLFDVGSHAHEFLRVALIRLD